MPISVRFDLGELEHDASVGGASCPEESLLRNVIASHLDPFTHPHAARLAGDDF